MSAADDNVAKPKTSFARMALFVVLCVAVIVTLFDYNARMSAKGAYEKVDGLLSMEDDLPQTDLSEEAARTPEEIQRLIGRAPDAPGVAAGDKLIESYSWRGAFKTFRVFVKYGGEPPMLDGVTTADPPVWK